MQLSLNPEQGRSEDSVVQGAISVSGFNKRLSSTSGLG